MFQYHNYLYLFSIQISILKYLFSLHMDKELIKGKKFCELIIIFERTNETFHVFISLSWGDL